MGCGAPRTLKIAAKWSISLHRVAGPYLKRLIFLPSASAGSGRVGSGLNKVCMIRGGRGRSGRKGPVCVHLGLNTKAI